MLIHCLTLKFASASTDADINAFVDALDALPDQIDVIVRSRHGRDLGDRPTNLDYAVVTEFRNTDDFYQYLQHPAHLALPRDIVESLHSVQFIADR